MAVHHCAELASVVATEAVRSARTRLASGKTANAAARALISQLRLVSKRQSKASAAESSPPSSSSPASSLPSSAALPDQLQALGPFAWQEALVRLGPRPDGDDARRSCGWAACVDPATGRPTYVNPATGETSPQRSGPPSPPLHAGADAAPRPPPTTRCAEASDTDGDMVQPSPPPPPGEPNVLLALSRELLAGAARRQLRGSDERAIVSTVAATMAVIAKGAVIVSDAPRWSSAAAVEALPAPSPTSVAASPVVSPANSARVLSPPPPCASSQSLPRGPPPTPRVVFFRGVFSAAEAAAERRRRGEDARAAVRARGSRGSRGSRSSADGASLAEDPSDAMTAVPTTTNSLAPRGGLCRGGEDGSSPPPRVQAARPPPRLTSQRGGDRHRVDGNTTQPSFWEACAVFSRSTFASGTSLAPAAAPAAWARAIATTAFSSAPMDECVSTRAAAAVPAVAATMASVVPMDGASLAEVLEHEGSSDATATTTTTTKDRNTMLPSLWEGSAEALEHEDPSDATTEELVDIEISVGQLPELLDIELSVGQLHA